MIFFLEKKHESEVFLIVPDVGGQADMVPKFSEQLEWTEKHMNKIKDAEQVWPTVWKLHMKDPISEMDKFFSNEAKLIKKDNF